MVDVILQLTPRLSESIKEIAQQKFDGNMSAVCNEALEFYVDTYAEKREQLKEVVQQIRREVEAHGGFDEKDMDQRIREYRKVKYHK